MTQIISNFSGGNNGILVVLKNNPCLLETHTHLYLLQNNPV